MYASQDSLFQLIHKLEPSEKKDFLKQLKQSANGTSNYQRLFEEMNVMAKYDEVNLKYKLRKYMTDGSFSVTKNKLNERLLDYLSVNRQTIHKRLHQWLDYIEILISRGLYDEANIYCEKVKKEARNNSFLYLIIEANYWKGTILQYIVQGDFAAAVNDLRAEAKRTAELMILNINVGNYYYEVASLVVQNPNVRNRNFNKQIEAFKKYEYFGLDASDKEYPVYTSWYLAMTKNMLYKFSGQFEEAYEQEKIVWDRFRANWKFYYTNKTKEAISAVVNYLEALSKTSHFEAYRKQMDFAEELMQKDMRDNAYLACTVKCFRLYEMLRTGDENIPDSAITDFTLFYEKEALNAFIDIKKDYAVLLYRLLFIKRRYAEAQHYAYMVIQEYKRTQVRPDVYEHARFSYLLYEFTLKISKSFEQMNKDRFQGDVKAYYDSIRRKPKEDDYRFELAFVDFFHLVKHGCVRQDILRGIDVLEKRLVALSSENSPYTKFMDYDFDREALLTRWREYL